MGKEARFLRTLLMISALTSMGAVHRTPNFTVQADSAEVARRVAEAAEQARQELAVQWLGHPLPKWFQPCPVQVKVGQLGAGGATSFKFDRGEVYGWKMTVQGSLERILDSVIPHEVCHTIFASHFRRPLPRWADEGAATLVEHESERRRQTLLLDDVLNNQTQFPLRKLLAMKEYPSEMRRMLVLYAQGYSLVDFLIEQGGRSRYLAFLETADQKGWDQAVADYYNHETIELLEQRWRGWVLAGSPRLADSAETLLAREETSNRFDRMLNETIRGQEPETSEIVGSDQSVSENPLNAPDPSRVRRSKGRTQALADGWSVADRQVRSGSESERNPVAERRRPRPKPLIWNRFPGSN